MAKLERVTGKVFGASAPLNEIGQFGSAKTGTPLNTQDVATIQSLPAYTQGWGSAILTSRNFPPIEEVTGVLKTISYQNCYLLQEGVPEYDINTEYSSSSIVKVTSGVNLTFYRSLIDNNIGNPLTDGTAWAQAVLTGARNVGEIIPSLLPLNDSSVHLLDGTLINGNGIYKDFVDYIANIYNSSLNYFCTEAEWQTSVNTYGSCGKFVYNNTDNTVRLPKISDILQGTTDVSALGNLVEAGLPNITGYFLSTDDNIYAANVGGAFRYVRAAGTGTGGSSNESALNFDASRSNAIYGNSATVQPQTIKVLYYIVLANAQKSEIQVDIDNLVEDLNGKADTNLENISPTQTIKDQFIDWSMPNYNSLISISSGFVAPSAGFVWGMLEGHKNGGYQGSLEINNHVIGETHSSGGYIDSACVTVMVAKGDNITFSHMSDTYFAPLKGV